MSEKRFKLDFDNHSQGAIMDRQDKYGQYCRLYDFGEVGRQQIVELLNEQQATISQLREMNGELREINNEIGDDLHNCRLNKNIISEKLKLWQDTLAEYNIYTITDLCESFELDAKINKEKDEKIKELEVKVLNLEDVEKMFAHTFIVEKGLEKEYVKWVTQVKKEILKDNNLKNVLIQTDKIINNHLKTHTSGCKCCKCKHFEQELCYKGHIVPYPYICNDYKGGI